MMATYKQWQDPTTGTVLAKVTDDGFFINGESRTVRLAYPVNIQPSGSVIPANKPYIWRHECWGKNGDEGYTRYLTDEQLFLAGAKTHTLKTILPAGAIVLSAQVSIREVAWAGGTSVCTGLGIAGGIVKYENVQNAPGLVSPKPAVVRPNGFTPLAAQEQLILTATTAGGAAGDTAYTAGRARVRVVYEYIRDLQNI